jgi:hypothetical protein
MGFEVLRVNLLRPLADFLTLFIFEFSEYDDEEIYEAPNSEASDGEKLNDTGPNFADIKTMGTENAKEKR